MFTDFNFLFEFQKEIDSYEFDDYEISNTAEVVTVVAEMEPIDISTMTKFQGEQAVSFIACLRRIAVSFIQLTLRYFFCFIKRSTWKVPRSMFLV